jgi:membrane protein YqaA with SNARE-associated domain
MLRAWRYAAVCTLASVVGGMLGYAIGYALFDQFAEPLIRFYHYQQAFSQFKTMFAQYGLWVILIKGLTPIPYKIVTIASGAAHFNFGVFMAASLATRGVRFFLVAGLLKAFGPPIRDFIERRLTLVTSVAAAGVVGGFLALRLL